MEVVVVVEEVEVEVVAEEGERKMKTRGPESELGSLKRVAVHN